MEDNRLDFRIDFEVRLSDSGDDAEDSILRYRGKIRVLDEVDNETFAGRIDASVIDVDSGTSSYHAILDVTADFAQYTPLISREGDDFSKAVYRASKLDGLSSPNLLILEELEILPDFRGQALGLQVIDRVTRRLGSGCGITAMLPHPLQAHAKVHDSSRFNQDMQYGAFDQDLDTGIAKLKKHYAKAGFVSLKGTPLMVRATHKDDDAESYRLVVA